ncbi:transposase [Nonomuraea sp. NPDC051941]|uniref:transposase n=1 Tax=Nonomuraea sp. NPDC051941 TaxID=3364373 RepID=UPI0037C54753
MTGCRPAQPPLCQAGADPARGAKPGPLPLADTAGAGHPRRDQTRHCAAFCTGCPLRSRCTQATAGRTLTVRPRHDEPAAVRRRTRRHLRVLR